jgi:hypothetical protein
MRFSLILFFLSSLFYINNANCAIQKSNTDDEYWYNPKMDFEQRRLLYLNYSASHSAVGDGREAVYGQISRLELGLPLNEAIIRESIAYIYTNKDCGDFAAGGLLRLIYLDKKKLQLSVKLKSDITKCLLQFKYWWDEPKKDTTYRCYHTENHQGIYHSNELLAGQLFKNEIFGNSQNGQYHIDHALERLNKWLDYRARFGFSEWLSNSYYEVDLMQLTNLNDFAEDATIRTRAKMVIDLLLYDISLNNFHGTFGSTHGRAYANPIKSGRNESTSSITKLMFGVGIFNTPVCMGAVALATSTYRCPAVIEKIATNYTQTIDCKQRQSIDVDDALQYGLSYTNELDTHLFWGMQEFVHPKVVAMSKQISQKYNTWPYHNYDDFIKKYNQQIKQYGHIVNPNLDRFALGEVNIETYRTNNYMLSCAQDFRPGTQGYQQHIWQATLGTDALVFTNHPGSTNERVTPNFWAGNAYLPRAVQYKNVSVCIYNIPEKNAISYSHAYFPRKAFDEVVENGNWVFARKDKGYIALYSQHKAEWRTNNNEQNELAALSNKNIWVCEMGDEATYKTFADFMKVIANRKISCNELTVQYDSPSQGIVQFGWTGDLSVANKPISIKKYDRFNNPFSTTAFPSKQIIIKDKDLSLDLDFANLKY